MIEIAFMMVWAVISLVMTTIIVGRLCARVMRRWFRRVELGVRTYDRMI